jgi:hypothetical protein
MNLDSRYADLRSSHQMEVKTANLSVFDSDTPHSVARHFLSAADFYGSVRLA